MATVITEECINCGACEPECPNTAIYQGGVDFDDLGGGKQSALSSEFFFIVPEKCSECVGFFAQEACAAVCPVDCCIPDPAIPETEDQLLVKAKLVHPSQEFGADFPSRFRAEPEAADTPDAPAEGAVPAGDAVAAPAAAPVAAQAATVEDFDVPIPCMSCHGEYEVGFRFITPGTVLRCPHCGVSFSPTQRMFLLVTESLLRYADEMNAEIDRHTAAVEDEQRSYERTARGIRESVGKDIRETMDRLTEAPQRSVFG